MNENSKQEECGRIFFKIVDNECIQIKKLYCSIETLDYFNLLNSEKFVTYKNTGTRI